MIEIGNKAASHPNTSTSHQSFGKPIATLNKMKKGIIKLYQRLKTYSLSKKMYLLMIRKSIIVIFIVLIIFILHMNSMIYPWNIFAINSASHHSNVSGIRAYYDNFTTIIPSGFLVWSDKCKIPKTDPFHPEIMKYFKRQKYDPCSTKEPLTKVHFNSSTKYYTLYINESLKIHYGSNLECCYQKILRDNNEKNADKEVTYAHCQSFKNFEQIPSSTDNILVKCVSNKTQVYIHGHAMMPERSDIRKRINLWENYVSGKKKAVSILMIGIDSISRASLIRGMPITAQKLYDNKWFELCGYNKIGDNTYPNLMAILTGFNRTNSITTICKPGRNPHDDCPTIWKLFLEHGYVTSYAEGQVSNTTFNARIRKSFETPLVDYYFRPFMIAAEKNFPIRIKSNSTFCLGNQHSADYIFDYTIELGTRFKNDKYFGLFRIASFSHNDISDCSSMDLKVAEYLEKLSTLGILNESVVIFFSDHGNRYGPIVKTQAGYFEERLPFMFIWLPQWLKTKYPEFVNGLNLNKNRLTNPYDIHMTLKHLLDLSGRTAVSLPKATNCPNCQSLLRPVPHNRSCEDIGIEDHWCTCIAYQPIEVKSDFVENLSLFVVDYINNYLQNMENASISNLCQNLQLHNTLHAARVNLTADNYSKNIERYRLMLTTIPGNGVFQATLRSKKDTGEVEVTGTVTRLNSYGSDSKCVSDITAKLYCFCNESISEKTETTVVSGDFL